MTTEQPDRLDRIERILEGLVASQQQGQQQINALAADQALEQQGRREFRADFEASINALSAGYADEEQRRREFRADFEASIADLVSQQVTLSLELQTLTANVNAHIAQTTSFLAAEQRDRAAFRSAMIGLQTETRNILQELAHLRRQQQNGSRE